MSLKNWASIPQRVCTDFKQTVDLVHVNILHGWIIRGDLNIYEIIGSFVEHPVHKMAKCVILDSV